MEFLVRIFKYFSFGSFKFFKYLSCEIMNNSDLLWSIYDGRGYNGNIRFLFLIIKVSEVKCVCVFVFNGMW